jgi:[ribosomal protein S5]-alanine N-acetyltransferase
MNIAETERLVLRTWTLDDLEAGCQIWGDPDVMRYVDDGAALTLDQVRRSILTGIRHQDSHSCQHWAVLEKCDLTKVIGACGFNVTDHPDELELVFHFSRNNWGQGFATEAARACILYAFQRLHASRLVAGAHSENQPSQRVLQKLEFRNTGMRWFEDLRRHELWFELPCPN